MSNLNNESLQKEAPQKKSLQEGIDSLQPWFHNLHLPDGTQTAPNHWLGDFPAFKWKEIAPHVPENLEGWKVLDVGCNAGFYSFELAKRGAQVTGIDIDEHYLKQARWAAKQLNLQDKVEFRQMQVYDLASVDEKWDLIWFMGVLYHLRYPLLALDILAEKNTRMMMFQTLSMPGDKAPENPYDREINDRDDLLTPGWPKMAFIEHKFAGDPTNWWLSNESCIEAMLRSCGYKITGKPGHEVFVAEKDPDNISSTQSWNRSEYLSATQKNWKEVVNDKTRK